VLIDPDDCKDLVDPIKVNEVLSSPLNHCVAFIACILFSYEDCQLGCVNQNRPLYVINIIGDKRINWILLDCQPSSIKGIENDRDNTKLVVPNFVHNIIA